MTYDTRDNPSIFQLYTPSSWPLTFPPRKFNGKILAGLGVPDIQITPEFELYVTPVQIAPGTFNLPISSPQEYSLDLSEQIGHYATLGMPEDTNALNDEVIDEDAFLMSCDSVMQERQTMFFYELGNFQEGILACVFDTTDRIQHMFWRYLDNTHPTALSTQHLVFTPDLIAGYTKNYRCSWQTAIGGIADNNVIEENKKKWSGDHCCDASFVPGVFFAGEKFSTNNISALDIHALVTSRIKN